MSDLLSPTGLRLVQIERALRSRRRPSRRELCDLTGASRPTFKRDLTRLRDELGAVIVYDPFSGGYELRNHDWQGVLPAIYAEIGRPVASERTKT